jgi:hypothetical protein
MQSRNLAELQVLCAQQGAGRFPPASGDDALDDLRAELAEYDGYAAGILQSALENEGVRREPVTPAFDLHAALERRIHETGRAGEFARVYLAYLTEIDARLGRAAELGFIQLAPPAAMD